MTGGGPPEGRGVGSEDYGQGMRRLLAMLVIVLPQRLKRLVGRLLLGWDIHPTARIGPSVILVRRLTMGPHSHIGPFNLIRDLDELRLDEGASIASRNWIKGMPPGVFYEEAVERDPSLVLGKHAMISVSHHIDCADRVELKDYAAIAGFNCVVLTHSLNFVNDRFATGSVVLHERAVLLSGSTLMMGTGIPARSIVSAGSVVTVRLTAEQTFYRGNPAEAVRELPSNLRFFKREGPQAQLAALQL